MIRQTARLTSSVLSGVAQYFIKASSWWFYRPEIPEELKK